MKQQPRSWQLCCLLLGSSPTVLLDLPFAVLGDNGVGANVLKTADGGKTFTNVPIHEPALMLMAVSASSPTSAAVSGLGLLGGGSQYTTDGQVFLNSSMPNVSMSETQHA